MNGTSRYLAASVLAVSAGSVFAQSSVTMFGAMDIAARWTKADGQPRRLSQSTDGLNNSGIGFSGIEDMGGGLSASFLLLMGANPDNGTTNAKFFNRRSTVSLVSPWGELRLGRDFVPTFWNLGLADPFGATGIAGVGNVHQMYEGARQDNSIGYFLPGNLGGVFGQAMVGSSEGSALANGSLPSSPPTRYVGGRIGWSGSALTVGIAAAQRKYALQTPVGTIGLLTFIPAAVAQPGDTQKNYNGYVTYKFAYATLSASYDQERLRDLRENVSTIGAIVPIGLTEIHAGYERSTLKNSTGPGSSNTVDQIKLGAVYNASKRTAVYTTLTRLDNKDQSRLTLSGNAAPTTPGGHSQGMEIGLRHFF